MDASERTGKERDRRPVIGAPRWVKVLGILAVVIVLLVVVLQLTGIGGEHGPGRHRGHLPIISLTGPGARLP